MISAYDSSRSKLGCAALGVCHSSSTFFFSFSLFFFCGHETGFAHFRWQPIEGQSTLRPSYNCASLTRLVKTSHRLHPRRLLPINSHPLPTHMLNNKTSRPALWTLPCSPQPGSAQVHSSRTHITSCLLVLPNPTTTQSCIG